MGRPMISSAAPHFLNLCNNELTKQGISKHGVFKVLILMQSCINPLFARKKVVNRRLEIMEYNQ